MAKGRSPLHRRARGSLTWGLVVFWTSQFCLGLAVETWLPEIRDEEFATKLQRLRTLTLAAPDRPSVVMLGSSRTLMAFEAAKTHVVLNGRPATVFNCGIRGGGPTLQLVCFRRLLEAGVQPDLLLVEVLLPLLNQPCPSPLEETWLNGGRLRAEEIDWIRPYHSQPQRLVRHWLTGRSMPWSTYRRELRSRLLPHFAEPPPSPRDPQPGEMDAHGWQPFFEEGVTPEQRRHFWSIACSQYASAFGPFCLSQRASRALEALLDLCRERGIGVILVLPPEGNEFRALYPPRTREEIERYVHELSRRWGLPLIDARDWVGDEGFWDGHHALPGGAAVYTQRLQDEALGPLLERWQRAESFHTAVNR